VVFDGMAGRYQASPLEAKPNEPIRLWVVNAGPTTFSAFHVIGALFDHVYADGNPTNVLNAIQTQTLPPGGGARLAPTRPDAGRRAVPVRDAVVLVHRARRGRRAEDHAGCPARSEELPGHGGPVHGGRLAGGFGARSGTVRSAVAARRRVRPEGLERPEDHGD